MTKRKCNNNNHIEESSISSTPTDNKDNESISSYKDDVLSLMIKWSSLRNIMEM